MGIKETLIKARGLFVEFDAPAEGSVPATPAAPSKTVEQVVKDSPGPNLDEIKVPEEPVTPSQPLLNPDASLNTAAVYRLANLPEAPMTAEQAIEIISSFPADLPVASRRAAMKVTLDAMSKATGASAESVVADASRKLAALASFAESYGQQADKYTALAELQIEDLQKQIEAKRASIADAQAKKERAQSDCERESDRLDDVLEFFTLDVGPSKHAG